MNSSSNYKAYTSQPSSISNSGVSDAINWLGGGFYVLAFLGLVIFIIWVWSMIAMINLNSRFKNFLNEYRQREDEKYFRNGVYLKQGSPSGVGAEGHSRREELLNYKTDEQRKVERAKTFADMKPRQSYVWAAVSIPVLLIILLVVISL